MAPDFKLTTTPFPSVRPLAEPKVAVTPDKPATFVAGVPSTPPALESITFAVPQVIVGAALIETGKFKPDATPDVVLLQTPAIPIPEAVLQRT